jgi:hypothetical protein
MGDMNVFDQKMYDFIKEDFRRGGMHEKVFKYIMLFWSCVFVVLIAFSYRYRITPATFQVKDAYYVSAEDTGFGVAYYYVDVEIDGRIKNADFNGYVKYIKEAYQDQFGDAYALYVRFYNRYHIHPDTGQPEGRPVEGIREDLIP